MGLPIIIGKSILQAKIYALEGDYVNAGLAAGAALLPSFTGAAVVWGKAAFKTVDSVAGLSKIVKKVDNITAMATKAVSTAKKQVSKITRAIGSKVDDVFRSSKKASAIIKDAPLNIKSACFTEDTLVLSKDGFIKIKDIKINDLVYSENPLTGEKGYKRVVRLFVKETKLLIHIFVGEEEIKATENHPFWVEGRGWVTAGSLEAGDVLRTQDGKDIIIDKVEFEHLEKPVKVYNFEVEDFHTYFVSGTPVLVHNNCAGGADNAIKGLNVVNDGFGGFKATVNGDPKAFAMFKQGSDGALFVSDYFKGNLQSGSEFLSQSIKNTGITPKNKMIFTNIINDETLLAYKTGISAADSLLGKSGTRVLNNLGSQIKNIEYSYDTLRNKLSVIFNLD